MEEEAFLSRDGAILADRRRARYLFVKNARCGYGGDSTSVGVNCGCATKIPSPAPRW